MFSKLNKNITTLFLDTQSDNFDTEGDVNIILSPSLYWVKKVSLPIKKTKDVKPLLKSIFEDILPDGTYSYSAYKGFDKDYFIFAYEDKKIIDLLESKNIKPSQVKHIYFAQSELYNISGAMKINKTQSIYVKDDIVVLLPCCWIKESGQLDISTLKLSNHHINLHHYTHIVDQKALYKIMAISIIFAFLMFVQYMLILQDIDHISDKKDNIFANYSLKPTTMQNISLLKEYQKTHTQQTNLRKYISKILSLNTDAKLTLISLENNKLNILMENIDKQGYVSIKEQLKDIEFISTLKGTKLTLEFKL